MPDSRCEQVSRLPGHAAERERCDSPATHYCESCDKELCLRDAEWHRYSKCDVVEGARPAPAERWEPCGECDTRGYLTERTDVDMERRWPCPICHGEGEFKVTADPFADVGA